MATLTQNHFLITKARDYMQKKTFKYAHLYAEKFGIICFSILNVFDHLKYSYTLKNEYFENLDARLENSMFQRFNF